MNHEQLLYKSFLHQAWIIQDHGIPRELCINTDQTQVHYQMGGDKTWTKAGAKQVTMMGMDKKWAFMLVPSIPAIGDFLPFQAIFFGKSLLSCPRGNALNQAEAEELGFKFEPPKLKTYWSTQAMMVLIITNIIVPYFDCKK